MKRERETNTRNGRNPGINAGRKSIRAEIPKADGLRMKRKRGWSANEALERSRAKRGYRSRTKDMHIEWGGGGAFEAGLETGRRGTTGTGPVEMEEAPRTTMACAASSPL